MFSEGQKKANLYGILFDYSLETMQQQLQRSDSYACIIPLNCCDKLMDQLIGFNIGATHRRECGPPQPCLSLAPMPPL
jgi:hypothetical protein